MNRRRFLGLLGALPALTVTAAATSPGRDGLWLSARGGAGGRWFLCGFDGDGATAFDLPLPGRGHGIAVRPGAAQAVLVSRRPGRYLLVVDLAQGRALLQADAAPRRHFCGHGVFSADGGLLFTTENDYDAGRGVIGVRDAADGYRQVAELPSHGIGPHELLLVDDGRALLVANGGILTHPDTGRAKLNLDSMFPSLAWIDPATGALLRDLRLPRELHQLSIRHLAAGADGTVCAVMQYEGPQLDDPPLIALHRPGEESLRLLRAPGAVQRRMKLYCGSVAADRDGHWFAVSHPRGNLITFWNRDGAFVGSVELADGCGLTPGTRPGEFVLTGGDGARRRYSASAGEGAVFAVPPPPGARWDNHLAWCHGWRGGGRQGAGRFRS